MNILFDYQSFTQKIGGVSRVSAEIMRHFPKEVDYKVAMKVCDNVYVREYNIIPGIKQVPVSRDNIFTKKKFPGKIRIYNYLSSHLPFLRTFEHVNKPVAIELLKRGEFDIFHYPLTEGDDYFLEYLQGKKLVVTVHDMISEIYGGDGAQTKFKRKVVQRADHIIAISDSTKKDLIRILNVPDEKITVIYHGAPESSEMSDRLEPNPYFLFVGRRLGYKNFKQTLVDFAKFHQTHNEVKLLCTGGTFTVQELEIIRNLNIQDYCKTIMASDQELACLYHYAIAFIYPSLYEGFGLPILEAFTYKCPVLSNDMSCLPEIGADAAIYFHSINGESNLASRMEEIYSLSQFERDLLINKGTDRVSEFSWEKSANQLFEVYKKVLYKNV